MTRRDATGPALLAANAGWIAVTGLLRAPGHTAAMLVLLHVPLPVLATAALVGGGSFRMSARSRRTGTATPH